MTLQDRITVSTEETMQRIEQGLEQLRRFQYDSHYRKLLGETIARHMAAWDEKIRARRKDPFTIVVVGEFKRGKSSFINALLGESILPTDVTPETVTMNRLSYGIHKNEAVLSGGRRLALSDEELTRSALERLMAEAGEPIRQIELQRPNEWLRDIRIIDTPGMNDALGDLDTIAAEALTQADAVIYVYSVSYPLSRSEQLYLKYSILPQRYTKLFLVGNYGDLMESKENLLRMRELLRQRMDDLLPGEQTYIISSLDELCRIMEVRRPCEELAPSLEAEFVHLKEALTRLIQEKKTVVAADRMQRMVRLMVEELLADLNNLEKGLEMSAKELQDQRNALLEDQTIQNQRLTQAREQISATVASIQGDAQEWMEALLARMEQEDLSAYSAHDILQYYSYYCIDLLQEGLHTCLEQHREELLEQMSDISDTLGKDLAGAYTAGDKLGFSFRLNNSTWTRGDSITLAITQLSNNSLINAVADLVGGIARKNEVEADKCAVLAEIKSKYPQLRQNVRQDIEAKYASLERSAGKLLSEYYQGQIHRAEEAVAQYEEMAQKDGGDKEQVSQAIAELREALDGVKDFSR